MKRTGAGEPGEAGPGRPHPRQWPIGKQGGTGLGAAPGAAARTAGRAERDGARGGKANRACAAIRKGCARPSGEEAAARETLRQAYSMPKKLFATAEVTHITQRNVT